MRIKHQSVPRESLAKYIPSGWRGSRSSCRDLREDGRGSVDMVDPRKSTSSPEQLVVGGSKPCGARSRRTLGTARKSPALEPKSVCACG